MELLQNYKRNEFRIFLALIYALSFYGITKLFTDTSIWWLVISLIWAKLIGLFGHSIGLHRYFSHKSFNTTSAGEKFLAWASVFLGSGSPIQYARNHRQHHKVADTASDFHSPVIDGKLKTILGAWEFRSLKWFIDRGGAVPRDLISNTTCKFIHDNYYKIWYSLLLIFYAIDWHLAIYVLALPVLYNHLEYNFLINCAGHAWGYRNFNTSDASKNCSWVKYFSWGEAYHNNHHAHPNLYDFAVVNTENDLTAQVIERWFAVDGKQTEQGKLKVK